MSDPITLKVNGEERQITVRPADTLLFALRLRLGLTGAKPGRLNGDCGACTVLTDGVPMKSCLMLAAEGEGKDITTIEGLINTPIQKAFIEKFAFQCGYCTPGFLMNCHALVNTEPNASDDTIKIGWSPIFADVRVIGRLKKRLNPFYIQGNRKKSPENHP